MPAWIHNRAEHLLAKNPSMKKSTAFAIATQQAHATGKSPKGYGTSEGKREAKKKFDKPKKEYVKTPNPGDKETPKLHDEPKTKWTGSKLVKKEAQVEDFFDHFSELFKLAFKQVGGFWKAQAGFTPVGMKTPVQRLKKSMGEGKFKQPKLKPLNIKVGQVKEAFGTTGGYLHRQLGQPKLKPKKAGPPDKGFQVKQGGPEPEDVEFGDETDEVKQAFRESQYSGGTGPAPFSNYASRIPPFTSPPLSKSGGPKPPKGKVKKAAGLTPAGQSPKSRLSAAQKVGKPKLTMPAGPSIADQSKPIGFGKPLPGATKSP